jgi:hypothetical protein
MTTNRRRSRRSSARAQTNVQVAGAGAADTQLAAAGDAAEQLDLHQEYAYVLTDLRTLLIVSGLLFGAIIVLAFVL